MVESLLQGIPARGLRAFRISRHAPACTYEVAHRLILLLGSDISRISAKALAERTSQTIDHDNQQTFDKRKASHPLQGYPFFYRQLSSSCKTLQKKKPPGSFSTIYCCLLVSLKNNLGRLRLPRPALSRHDDRLVGRLPPRSQPHLVVGQLLQHAHTSKRTPVEKV